MARFLALLAAIAALTVNVAFAGSPWPQGGYDAQHSNFNRVEAALSAGTLRTLHVAWSTPGIVTMVSGGSDIYAVSRGANSRLLVINPQTGAIIRSFTAGALGLPASGAGLAQALALWNGEVIVGATKQVLALNPTSGKLLWRVTGGADQLVVSGDTLFTGKGCQNPCGLLASQGINLRTGKLLWTHRGNFGHAPALIGGHLYQSWGESSVGRTSIYNPITGALLARMPAYGTWTGDAGHTFVYSTGGTSPSTARATLKEVGPDGRALWSTDVGRAGDGYLVYAYGTIFTGSYRYSPGMVAVNASNGRVRWADNLGRYLHLAAANHLLVAANDQTGRISVLDAGSGKVLRQLTLPNKPYAVTGLAIAGGTIYVTDGSGLVAIRS